ncbi:hypothetical protein EDB82DRAFT_196854 [Fusarium venenatum]|uniref:uncharacterized protein n=1 Tax=Fusarium venenatum TaxID=56646 RepID=UPI001D8F0D27|nr:hypothetical protein EDB82DRAFT_196854 [Fusarium venenatum]
MWECVWIGGTKAKRKQIGSVSEACHFFFFVLFYLFLVSCGIRVFLFLLVITSSTVLRKSYRCSFFFMSERWSSLAFYVFFLMIWQPFSAFLKPAVMLEVGGEEEMGWDGRID